MTILTYIDDLQNSGATTTVMNQGDVLVSPNGLYNAALTSNGTLAISYLSTPNTLPTTWSAPGPGGSGPFRVDGDTFPVAYTGWQLDWGVVNSQNVSKPFIDKSNTYLVPDYLALNDDGTLSVYQGNNGVKNSPNEGASVTIGTSNPFKGLTVDSVTYDSTNTVFYSVNSAIGTYTDYKNNTNTTESFPYNETLTYLTSDTFTWNQSGTLSGTISSSTTVPIPGIGTATQTLSFTGSATIANGQSTTQSQTLTYKSGGTLTVPAHSEYSVAATAYDEIAAVPFTWSGTANYANGYMAPYSGSGTVIMDDTGIFNTAINCITGCSGAQAELLPSSPMSAPEPPAYAVLPLGFAAMLALAAIRKQRHARHRGPSSRLSAA